MFDFHDFNNLITNADNRSKIRAAHVQVISKTVRKIRKLKTETDKNPEDKGRTDRLRRATECLACLKKLKPIDVMRQVLLLEAKPSAIITNGKALPETQAVAMLALHKHIEQIANTIRQELKLDERDSAWREEILKTSKNKAKKERAEKKKSERTELKVAKEFERKRNEWIQENRPEATTSDSSSLVKVPESSPEKKQAEAKAKTKPHSEDDSEGDDDANKGMESCDMQDSSQAESVQHSVKLVAPKEESSTPTSEIPTELNEAARKDQPTNHNQAIESSLPTKFKQATRIEIEPSINQPTADKEVQYTDAPDPFFLTETGAPYRPVLLAVPKQDKRYIEFDDNEDESQRRGPQKKGTDNFHSRKGAFQTKDSLRQIHYQQKEEVEEDLHPSWAAKRKLKPIICQPTGKKVVFDYNGA